MNTKEIGKRMRDLRERDKKGVTELATELGISQPTLSNYEAGKRLPDLKLLLKYSKKFNVTMDYLCGQETPVLKSRNAVYLDEIEKFKQTLSTIDPQLNAAAKIIQDFNRLCGLWKQIHQIWGADDLVVSVSMFSEFINVFCEQIDAIACYPHFDFNEVPSSVILEHTIEVFNSKEVLESAVKKFMDFAINKIRGYDADAN